MLARGLLVALVLLVAAGCCGPRPAMPQRVEAQVAAVTPIRAGLGPVRPVGYQEPSGELPIDLAALWRLTVTHNSTLRDAAAEVEAARGLQIQAGKYPNPRFAFAEDTIGSRAAPSGNVSLQITQEIVTGGKRRLDVAMAERETVATFCGLMSRKFEVMTRLRRAYYGYLGATAAMELNEAAVLTLQKGVATTRQLVEVVQARPKTDLLRLEALLEETKINLAKSQFNVDAAWKQVAAEVGVPELPMPKTVHGFGVSGPHWEAGEIWQRVQSANNGLRQATAEAERARLAVDRARAEAIPNVTVGGGYVNAPIESTAGAIITVETPLPLWDLKQGHIHEAQARLVKAQAAVRTVESTLSAAVAEAFARYQGTQRQVDKLTQEVVPRLQESVDLLLRNYQLGGAGVTFTDVLTTEQSLIETRLKLAEARQAMWQAVADLQGLMQLEVDEDLVVCPLR